MAEQNEKSAKGKTRLEAESIRFLCHTTCLGPRRRNGGKHAAATASRNELCDGARLHCCLGVALNGCETKKREKMVDYCTTKQISTFILALIGFSILVFFIEEYTEENEMQSEMEMRNAFYKNEHGTDVTAKKTTEYPIEECWKYEQVQVVSECTACKEFEIKAIKAAHCLKTGYYDRVNCSKSATTVLRPCASPKESRRREFYGFCIFNSIVLAGSYVATTQRKAILDRAMYMRLPQHF